MNCVNQRLITHGASVAAPETCLSPFIPKDTIFSVPPKPEFFQGRDDCLGGIRRKLSPDEQQSVPKLASCLITAMGGMGKTRIALEYAHRYRKLYDFVFWLGAQQWPKLWFSFASIAIQLGIPHAESMGGSPRYELVKDWLETTGKASQIDFQDLAADGKQKGVGS